MVCWIVWKNKNGVLNCAVWGNGVFCDDVQCLCGKIGGGGGREKYGDCWTMRVCRRVSFFSHACIFSVVQCVTEYYSVLQRVAVFQREQGGECWATRVWRRVSFVKILQHTATHYNTLLNTAEYRIGRRVSIKKALQSDATHFNTLHHTESAVGSVV